MYVVQGVFGGDRNKLDTEKEGSESTGTEHALMGGGGLH